MNPNEGSSHLNPKLRWDELEYHHVEKHPDWFWAVGIITVFLAVVAMLFGNILFGLLLVIGGFCLLVHAARPAEMIHFELSTKGLRIEKQFYPYHTLASFWIEEHETHRGLEAKLIIKSKKTVMPLIIIPINMNEIDPEEARIFLSAFLPEEEHHEPLGHKVMEMLGF
jgi:hypothetical protein